MLITGPCARLGMASEDSWYGGACFDSEIDDDTISDIKSGNINRIADKIDSRGELKDSVSDIKASGDFDDAIEELSNIKNIGGDAGKQIATSARPPKTQTKASKAKSAKKNKS